MTQPKEITILMGNKEEERVLPIILRRSQSQEIMRASDALKNVHLTYVCLVNDTPLASRARLNHDQYHVFCNEIEQKDQEPIQVERSKAHHNLDLKEDVKKPLQDNENKPTTSEEKGNDNDDFDLDFQNFIGFDNPNVLCLTRMKWLTDGTDGNTNASSPSLSLSSSNSTMSQDSVIHTEDQTDRHLSTIISIDKEHNLFGLWSLTGLGKREVTSSILRDRRAMFHQTTIVQVCCGPAECTSGCCQYKSKTDLPCSLKCNSCRNCTTCCDPCSACGPCGFAPFCGTCQSPPCKFSCVGLVPFKIHNDHEVNEVELTPRSSCVQQLPQVMRECHHRPRCQPPSTCFPYLMPCFWPARPNAPCHDPRKCFHVPPCLPPRRPIQPKNPATACPPAGKCTDIRPKSPCGVGRRSVKVSGCINPQCPGKIPGYKDAILSKFSKQLKKC